MRGIVGMSALLGLMLMTSTSTLADAIQAGTPGRSGCSGQQGGSEPCATTMRLGDGENARGIWCGREASCGAAGGDVARLVEIGADTPGTRGGGSRVVAVGSTR